MSFKFSYTAFDISPEKEIPLSGLLRRDDNSKRIGINECQLKVAWLSFSEDQQFVFFLADFLFFPDMLATKLASTLLNNYGIPKNHIVFGGTHTHSGPALGFLPWENEQPEYLERIYKMVVAEIPSLVKRLEAGVVQLTATQVADVDINRRRIFRHWKKGFKRKAFMFPNPEGPINPRLNITRFKNLGGKKLWFLSWASHPVFNRNQELSSDYPGALAQRIKDKGWADEVFVFPGFGGDVRPNYFNKNGLKDKFNSFVHGPDFGAYLPDNMQDYLDKILRQIEKTEFGANEELSVPKLSELQFELASQTRKTSKKIELRHLDFGKQFKMIIVNAEMFCHYGLLLPKNVFAISCTDTCIGYVPTSEDIPYGGYEVEIAPLNNKMDGPMIPEQLEEFEKEYREFIGK